MSQEYNTLFDAIIAQHEEKCAYEKHYITPESIENVFNYNYLKQFYNEELGHNYSKFLEHQRFLADKPKMVQPKCQFLLFILPHPTTLYFYKTECLNIASKKALSYDYSSDVYKVTIIALEIYAIESEQFKNNPCFYICDFYNEEKPFTIPLLANVTIGKDNEYEVMASTDKEKLYKKIIEHKHSLIKKYTNFMLESMTKLTIIDM